MPSISQTERVSESPKASPAPILLPLAPGLFVGDMPEVTMPSVLVLPPPTALVKSDPPQKSPPPLPEDEKVALEYDTPNSSAKPKVFRDLSDAANLHASGSGQLTCDQIAHLRQWIPQDKKDILIVDLREESHGFDSRGEGIVWRNKQNTVNLSISAEALLPQENALVASQGGKTEADLCSQAGFKYLRLPVTDHCAPQAVDVKSFLQIVLPAYEAGAQVHFHCHGGAGRTTTFLTMLDICMNPEASLEDILRRQFKVGGADLQKIPDAADPKDGWKREGFIARLDFLQKFSASRQATL